MKIYHFDRQTGAYSGTSPADESQMEPGTFLLPAFATVVEPPTAPAGQVAVFCGDAWELQAIAPQADATPAPLTPHQRAETFRAAVRAHANAVAIAQGFDSIDEAVSYADEPAVPEFQAQGRALRAWRSVLWQAAEGMIALIASSEMPETDERALLALLPAFQG